MSAIDPNGDEKYYVNGETFQGIRNQPTKIGEGKYWSDGMPEENLTPPNNKDTGKFFLVFE